MINQARQATACELWDVKILNNIWVASALCCSDWFIKYPSLLCCHHAYTWCFGFVWSCLLCFIFPQPLKMECATYQAQELALLAEYKPCVADTRSNTTSAFNSWFFWFCLLGMTHVHCCFDHHCITCSLVARLLSIVPVYAERSMESATSDSEASKSRCYPVDHAQPVWYEARCEFRPKSCWWQVTLQLC